MRMPFGKHAGVELTDVPRQYLRWLRTQPWLGAWLVKEIDDVLNGNVVPPSDESFEEILVKWQVENLACSSSGSERNEANSPEGAENTNDNDKRQQADRS